MLLTPTINPRSGTVTAERLVVAGGAAVGILVERGGSLALRDSLVEGNGAAARHEGEPPTHAGWRDAAGGRGAGLEARGAGSAPRVERTDFIGGGGAGVFLHGAAGGRFTDCHMSRNHLPAVELAGAGTDPVLTHCSIEAAGSGRAVLVTEGAGGRFLDCDLSADNLQPLFIDQAADPTLQGCRIHGSSEAGVLVTDGGRCAVMYLPFAPRRASMQP